MLLRSRTCVVLLASSARALCTQLLALVGALLPRAAVFQGYLSGSVLTGLSLSLFAVRLLHDFSDLQLS